MKPKYKRECENCKLNGEETIIEGTDKEMVESAYKVHLSEYHKQK